MACCGNKSSKKNTTPAAAARAFEATASDGTVVRFATQVEAKGWLTRKGGGSVKRLT